MLCRTYKKMKNLACFSQSATDHMQLSTYRAAIGDALELEDINHWGMRCGCSGGDDAQVSEAHHINMTDDPAAHTLCSADPGTTPGNYALAISCLAAHLGTSCPAVN